QEAAGERPPAFVLAGHKSDVASKRVVSAEETGHLAATLGMTFVETSSHTNLNVELAFQMLVVAIQQALGEQEGLNPHGGCGGIRLIPRAATKPWHRESPRS
ncbi:RAB42 protein, partial [Tricholaema leucomelas]|nr:RAB42 protein [Tricholaema leucomelas]